MKEREGLTIRSFRVVFDLERRIHKIDRWRIPVPYGVPLRGIGYWAAALFATVLLGRLPLGGDIIGIAPAPIRLVILPIAVAYGLARIQVDGRPAHSTIGAWSRFRLSFRRLAGLRAVPSAGTAVSLGDVALLADERCARYRRAVITGPVTVLLRYPPFGHVKGGRRSPALHVRQLPGPPLFVGKQVRLGDGQRMTLHG
jgi:hypothetical protein